MYPPICKQIGTLRYKGHKFEYVYNDGLKGGALFNEDVSKKLKEFLKKYYKNCFIQKLGIGVLLDLNIEYEIKDNVLWPNKIYLKCDNNRALNIHKKATWISKMVVKTLLEYKTFFYFKNAKLIKIKKTKEECINPLTKLLRKYIN